MNRFYGAVGYAIAEEVIDDNGNPTGVWEDKIIERHYYGETYKRSYKWSSGDQLNDDVNLNMEIKIMADPYSYEHISHIKYVKYMGAKWKVTSASPERPRITLSIGGIYNG